jgi:hypothetical protein
VQKQQVLQSSTAALKRAVSKLTLVQHLAPTRKPDKMTPTAEQR